MPLFASPHYLQAARWRNWFRGKLLRPVKMMKPGPEKAWHCSTQELASEQMRADVLKSVFLAAFFFFSRTTGACLP